MMPPPSSSRSFSELYTLSLKEPSRRGVPEPVQEETIKVVLLPPTKQLLHFCLQDSSGPPPGPGDLTEERTEFLHSHNSLSPRRYTLWASPSLASLLAPGGTALSSEAPSLLSSLSDEAPVLPNTTPDLLLVTTANPSAPGTGRETPPSQVSRNIWR